jgi:phosphatidate cytidylyltransferase
MKTRAITGFFFIIVMLASVLCGHYVFDFFYLILSAVCLYEFYGLIKQSSAKPSQVLGIITGVLVYTILALMCASYNDLPSYRMLLILVPFLTLIFIQELYKKSTIPFINIAYTFLGIVFVILPFSFFHAMAYVKAYVFSIGLSDHAVGE